MTTDPNAELVVATAVVRKLVDAMRRYEMDVADDEVTVPLAHRDMMAEATAFLDRNERPEGRDADTSSGGVADAVDFEAVLNEIVEIGTRRSSVRVGDMYDFENGYEDRVVVSEEARIAAAALGLEIDED